MIVAIKHVECIHVFTYKCYHYDYYYYIELYAWKHYNDVDSALDICHSVTNTFPGKHP